MLKELFATALMSFSLLQPVAPSDGWLDIEFLGDSNARGMNVDGSSGCNGTGSDGPRQYFGDLAIAQMPTMFGGFNQQGCHGNTWSEGWGGRSYTNVFNDISWITKNPNPTGHSIDMYVVILGLNDMNNEHNSAEETLGDAIHFLDWMMNNHPESKILLSTVTCVSAGNQDECNYYNSLLQTAIARRDQNRVGIADLGWINNADLMPDHIHWNDAGNRKIAQALFNSAPMLRWWGVGTGQVQH